MAKTSLRKIYAWGNNNHGQLGAGHFKRITKPRIVDYFKHNFVIEQIASSAYGSVAIDSNGRLFWWGTNGTITKCSLPREVLLF
jgi:alpha-tubulin suppressor-like RCC1 family protein